MSELEKVLRRAMLDEITTLRKRVEELEGAASRAGANMHMFREERDHYCAALEEIEHSCDGCGHCKEDGFTGNCNAFIAKVALREET